MRQAFKPAMVRTCQWASRNAVTLSGYCGIIAGGFVIVAGASSLQEPALIASGVLEWTSFGTSAYWGRNDEDKEGDVPVQFSLTRGLMPWRYPLESFMLQQGLCGLGYVVAGLDLPAIAARDYSSIIKTSGLVAQGFFCSVAPFIQSCFKEREGWQHPRTLASACLFVSSLILGVAAVQTSSVLLGAATICFIGSNIFSAVSRRRNLTPSLNAPVLG